MELVEKYIGQWGRYQAYLYALFCLPFAISGIQVMAFTFTGGVPRTRCFLPRFDDNSKETEFEPSTLKGDDQMLTYYQKPKKFAGKLVYCKYCPESLPGPLTTTQGVIAPLGAPGNNLQNSLDQNFHCVNASAEKGYDSAESCKDAFVYDKSQFRSTLVAKLDMVCENNWKRSLASSFFMFGFLVGAATSGTLSDRFGRKPVFLVLSLLGMVTYHLIILVPNFPMLCVFHILNGAFCHGAYITAFVIVMEYIGGMAGTICGIWVQGVFAIGYIYVGICAYLIRDWKWLQFALAAPSLGLIPYFWLVPESIRWLIVHGKKDEAKRLIIKAAKFNRRPITDEAALEADIGKVTITENVTVIHLLTSNRSLTIMTLIIFYSWFATSMTYYGISLNTGDLPGNEYLIYIISGLVELPAYAISIPMMEKWGRRPSIVASFGFGGFAIILSTFLPKSFGWGITILAMIGKMGASASFAVIYNYSAELFPTVGRNSGIGFASSCARVASISAPQIYLLGQYTAPWFPFLIYGSCAILAAVVDYFLPETLGRPLPESLQDGVEVAQKKWGPSEKKSGLKHGRVAPTDNLAMGTKDAEAKYRADENESNF